MIRLGKSPSPSFRKKRLFLPSATMMKLLCGTCISVSLLYPRSTRNRSACCALPGKEAEAIAEPWMRILLTNDDGVNATGLKVLETIAQSFSDDVWIVAPTEEQSGAGHSLTLSRPVRLRKLGERRFCVTGTPTDAVMMAIAWIMKDSPPDLILSGVNRGANLGEDVTYSGTVSAAMEGALAGIPSIALSQAYVREGMGDTPGKEKIAEADRFATAEAWADQVLRPLIGTPMAPRTL